MTAPAVRKQRIVRNDPRVIELVNCLCFALSAFRDRPIFDHKTRSMESWKTWFRRAIEGAGFRPEEHP